MNFTFWVDGFAGDSEGVYKFGPDLGYRPLTELLKSHHQYKITRVSVRYRPSCGSNTAGALACELDASKTYTKLTTRARPISLWRYGSWSYRTSVIRGTQWLPTSENQFHLLYSSNGSHTTVGSLEIKFTVRVLDPKSDSGSNEAGQWGDPGYGRPGLTPRKITI
jgi:hypothetical protein